MTRQARRELVAEGVKISTGEASMLFFANDMVMVAESDEELQSNTAQLQKKVIINISTTCFVRHSTRTKQQCSAKRQPGVLHVGSKEQQWNLLSLPHVGSHERSRRAWLTTIKSKSSLGGVHHWRKQCQLVWTDTAAVDAYTLGVTLQFFIIVTPQLYATIQLGNWEEIVSPYSEWPHKH